MSAYTLGKRHIKWIALVGPPIVGEGPKMWNDESNVRILAGEKPDRVHLTRRIVRGSAVSNGLRR